MPSVEMGEKWDIYWAPINCKALGREAEKYSQGKLFDSNECYQMNEWETLALSLYMYKTYNSQPDYTCFECINLYFLFLHCLLEWLAFNKRPRKACLLINFYITKKMYIAFSK